MEITRDDLDMVNQRTILVFDWNRTYPRFCKGGMKVRRYTDEEDVSKKYGYRRRNVVPQPWRTTAKISQQDSMHEIRIITYEKPKNKAAGMMARSAVKTLSGR